MQVHSLLNVAIFNIVLMQCYTWLTSFVSLFIMLAAKVSIVHRGDTQYKKENKTKKKVE